MGVAAVGPAAGLGSGLNAGGLVGSVALGMGSGLGLASSSVLGSGLGLVSSSVLGLGLGPGLGLVGSSVATSGLGMGLVGSSVLGLGLGLGLGRGLGLGLGRRAVLTIKGRPKMGVGSLVDGAWLARAGCLAVGVGLACAGGVEFGGCNAAAGLGDGEAKIADSWGWGEGVVFRRGPA